jgi:hypothetical protein
MTQSLLVIDGSRLFNAMHALGGDVNEVTIDWLSRSTMQAVAIERSVLYVGLPPEAVYPSRRSDLILWTTRLQRQGVDVVLRDQMAIGSVLVDHDLYIEMSVDIVAFAAAAGSNGKVGIVSNHRQLLPAVARAQNLGATAQTAFFEYGFGLPGSPFPLARHSVLELSPSSAKK